LTRTLGSVRGAAGNGGPYRNQMGEARRLVAGRLPIRSPEGEHELLSEFEKDNLKRLEKIAATP